eukprot:TRINITY_DN4137_c0_g1_i2.p1 TRINITY_DN4137_c0_g1~~TRINITY_DN4137_c0_g1_i2.p1  ORF type:complete len:730 (-),score=220.18 TRINITY_DN4137_c0_g1_i2:455-2644(-)
MRLCRAALLLWASFCGVFGHSVIDEILDKHWHKFEAEVLSKRAAGSFSKDTFEAPFNHSFSYECEHDRRMAKIGIPAIRRKARELSMQQQQRPATKDTDRLSSEGPMLGGTATDRQNWQPIRIYADTTRLSNSDSRACIPGRTQVAIGTPTSSRSCTASIQDDCYYTCTAQDVLDNTMAQALAYTVVPAMMDVIQRFVRTSRVQGNLFLDRTLYDLMQVCGDGIQIPTSIVAGMGGSGIPNSDVLVYVTARPAASIYTVAYASSCNWMYDAQNDALGRTLAGNINFSPRYFRNIASGNAFAFRVALRPAIHEMVHLLGFSSFLYSNYHDNDGELYPNGGVTQSSSLTFNGQSRKIQKIVTPRVTQFGKEHFNCPSLNGFELENAGGSGTAGSHWERRIAGNELMCGFINDQMPITGLTMSLLEDTGYYATDYSAAENLQWGQNQGCGFATGRCETTWTSPGYFCSSSLDPIKCSPEGDSFGKCNFVYNLTSSAPGPYDRHFPNNRWAGGDANADYCTFTEPTTFCLDPSQSSSNGGQFGSNSTCFTLAGGSGPSADCFSFSCPDANTLRVTVSGVSTLCPQGTSLNLPSGRTLPCPSAVSVCNRTAYLSAWPRVASIAPTSGIAAGGATVTIRGSFVPGRSYQVFLGKLTTSSVTVVDATTITARTESGECCGRIVDVSVVDTANGNKGVLFASFTFTDCTGGQCSAAFNLVPPLLLSLMIFVFMSLLV